jgi:hypothetical protein
MKKLFVALAILPLALAAVAFAAPANASTTHLYMPHDSEGNAN